MSSQDKKNAAERYYDENTEGIYIRGWNREHIHFGLFEPGECPEPGESLADSAGLASAVERMVDVIVAPGKIARQHHVMDAGCGVGGTAIRLARQQGCKVTGVNINRMQLKLAGEKVSAAGLDDLISFRHGDCARRLPFKDDSIDVVVNIESACHYSDRQRFLHEVKRILKPDGKIVAMDWMARDGLTNVEYKEYIEPLCKPFAVQGLESPTSYSEKLSQAGLEILEFADFGGKDADNMRLVKNAYGLLAGLQFYGVETEGIRGLLDQFKSLHEAWENGCFELGRYCARNPG